MKSYFDMYLSLYDDCYIYDKIGKYPIEDLLELLHCSKLSFDDEEKLLKLLDSFLEKGFNSGFEFAIKIFSNNL